ncbi:MAG: histidine kinase [Chloroflexi bacterium]|nr:histidine kinase [Chloroflexota bacterium]
MSDLPFATFIQNAALLLAVTVLFDLVVDRFGAGIDRPGPLPAIATGLVLGAIGVSIMLTPFQLAPGLFFDARGVFLAAVGLFFGTVPTVLATACMIAFRIQKGGAGAPDAVAVLVVICVFALAWRRWRRGYLADISLRELWVLGLVSTLLLLVVVFVGVALTVDATIAEAAIRTISLPMLVVEPVATALLGGLMANRLRARRLTEANGRLRAEVEGQLIEVRASRARIVAAGYAERTLVERDVHDGAQQRLVGLVLSLRLARTQVGGHTDDALAGTLEEASAEAREALRELRELARGIHPQILTDGGLGPALESLADRALVAVDLSVDLHGRRFRPTVESTAYFVVAEALTNVAKYAGVERARLDAQVAGGVLRVSVEDEGAGGADVARGSGLRGLGDRLAAVNGSLEVDSPVGRGTRVRAFIPIDAPFEPAVTEREPGTALLSPGAGDAAAMGSLLA